MLQDDQRTVAPRATNVSISTAVWMVMCRQPAMRAPFSGWALPNSSRIAIRPGISVSAMLISLRPHPASERCLTLKSWNAASAMLEAPAWVVALYKDICMFARHDPTGLIGRGVRGHAAFAAPV